MAIPSDLAGLSLWLDAVSPGVTAVQGDYLSSWNDRSGNGRDFTATALARPAYIDKAAPSGLPLLRFDGAGSVMQSAATWADISNASVYTLFAVFNVIGKASEDTVNLFNNDLVFGSGATNYGGINVKNNGTLVDIIAYNWDGTADVITDASHPYNSLMIVELDHSATTMNLRVNGGAGQSLASGVTSNMTFPLKIGVVGGTNYAAIELGEIIAYNRVLNATELGQMTTYLTDKWQTVPAIVPTNTSMHFFRESFKALDPAKWTNSAPAGSSVSIVDDKLHHVATTGVTISTSDFGQLYDLTGSFLYCRAYPDKGGSQRWSGLYVLKDAGNYFSLFSFGLTNLYGRIVTANVTTDLGNIVYDPVQHAWWKISELAGTIYYSTAPTPPDGTGFTWTTRWTTPAPSWLLRLVRAHVQTSDTAGISSIAEYDSMNMRPATQHVLTLGDDELVAAGAVEGNNLMKVFVMDESGNWST